MKVSIIVPTYNCAQFLKEALDSIVEQTYQNYEAIIIDDGSTDNTKDIVVPYLEKYRDKFCYIYQVNAGLAAARNTGLKHSKGELIALLDADDKWCPNRLEEGVKAISKSKEIGLVHASTTRIDEQSKVLGTVVRQKQYLSGDIFKNIFLRKANLSCPTILFRKECTDQVGGFDEYLARLGCEDRELWLRISKVYKVQYIDKVLAYYRMRSSSMSKNNEKMLKAQLYVIDKFYPQGSKEQKIRKLALASIYRNFGDDALLKKDFTEARKYYLKSIQNNGLAFWAWINLLKSLLKVSS